MHRLMYVSAAARGFDVAELEDILAASRRNNAADGISGMLLHLDGGFLQILEGEEAAVRRAYVRIAKDPRHDDPRILVDAACEERLFPDWSMGFDRLQPGDEARAGVFEATRAAVEGAVSPDRALEIAVLLRTFYRVNTNRHAA